MTVDVTQPTSQDQLSLQELDLYHAIMDYRASLGLAPLPLSAALTTTAGRHVTDTRENIWAEGVVLPEGANLHSWSDAYYYADHRDPSVMWTAPARVGTDYPSSGYEISAAGFATVEAALAGWIGSPSHNAILAGTGLWEGIELRAIGIGVDTTPGAGIYAGRIFHVWFGESLDASTPDIRGGADIDVIRGTTFADRLFGLSGDDDISGDLGDDYISGGAGSDRLRGDHGYDVIDAGTGHDLVWGGSGRDTINGGGGNDKIWANEGADWVVAGGGDDFIVGGPGRDWLTGNAGFDTFVYNDVLESAPGATWRDVITDFTSGEDIIRLYWLDANALTPERDTFVYVGAADFSQTAGELRMSSGMIEADVTGDGVADMQIEVLGVATLAEADFIL